MLGRDGAGQDAGPGRRRRRGWDTVGGAAPQNGYRHYEERQRCAADQAAKRETVRKTWEPCHIAVSSRENVRGHEQVNLSRECDRDPQLACDQAQPAVPRAQQGVVDDNREQGHVRRAEARSSSTLIRLTHSKLTATKPHVNPFKGPQND